MIFSALVVESLDKAPGYAPALLLRVLGQP